MKNAEAVRSLVDRELDYEFHRLHEHEQAEEVVDHVGGRDKRARVGSDRSYQKRMQRQREKEMRRLCADGNDRQIKIWKRFESHHPLTTYEQEILYIHLDDWRISKAEKKERKVDSDDGEWE